MHYTIWKKPESKGFILDGSLYVMFGKGKTIVIEKRSDYQGSVLGVFTKEQHTVILGVEGIVPYLDCSDGYTAPCICQRSLELHQKELISVFVK